MEYDQKQFTQDGLNMFTNALSNKTNITVDKVIADDLPTNNLSNLALLSLNNFADALSFTANYTKVDNNVLTVDAIMSNEGFSNSYTVNEVGLVGHVGNDSNNQSLIAVLVASDPFTIPAQQNDETPLHLIPNITIQLSNNDMGQVPVDTSQDAYIAHKDLDKLVAQDGYIKLTDADNRYVKQSDFNNEVNQSVNEKADKSYVDQSFNQTNNEVDKKADKTDLNSLQNNINSDVQPQLNQKANQSDLSDTNNNVNSKANQSDLNNTNDVLSDVRNNRLPQTLNQATTHSDQNYSDLSDKNNILSNQISDYQKPNLSPVTEYSYYGWAADTNSNGTFQINVEKGKNYYFSLHVDSNNSNFGSRQIGNGPASAIGQDLSTGNATINAGGNYVSNWQSDRTGSITVTFVSSQVNKITKVSNICITQSNSYVPYEIAENNRQVQNNNITNKDDLDNAKTDFTNKTNDLSGRIDDIDNHNFAELKPCDLNNVNQSGTYQSISPIINYKSTPQFSNIDVWYSFTMSVFSTGYDVLQILNISSNNPMFRFKSNDIWQNWYEASSKQDLQNLSNTMNQQFDQANAHTDQVANQLNALDITNQDGKLMHAGKPLLTANAPNAPSLSLSIDSNNNNVQYTITPPSIDGGASITGYTLYYVIEGNSNWQSIPLGTDNLSGEFPATQSVTYQAYAITHNYAGDSPNSITQSILTASAPTINNLTVTNNYPNGLQYNINASSNGATITYTIYYKRTSNNNWQTFNSNNNTGNITEISTDMDNAFQVQVYATNAAGISRGSNTVNQYYFDNTSLDSVISITYNDGGNTITYPISIQASTNVLNLYPNISQIKITHLQTENNSTVTNNINTLFNEPEDTSVTSIMNINSIFNSTNIQSGSTSLTHGDDGYHMYVIIQGMDSSGNNLGINSVHEI